MIPFVARSLALVLVISRFLNFIDPPELCFRPDSPLSKVVLPAPFAPIMAKKDPLFSVKVKSEQRLSLRNLNVDYLLRELFFFHPL